MKVKSHAGAGRRTTMTWKNARMSETGLKFTCLFTQTTEGHAATLTKDFYLQVKGRILLLQTMQSANFSVLMLHVFSQRLSVFSYLAVLKCYI